MSEYKECPKCGFKNTEDAPIAAERKRWKLKYEDRCFSVGCKWADEDVREHLHIFCPDCGYQVGVQGCNDYKQLKEKVTKRADAGWTQNTNTHSSTAGRGRGHVDVGGWDAVPCEKCPIDSTDDGD